MAERVVVAQTKGPSSLRPSFALLQRLCSHLGTISLQRCLLYSDLWHRNCRTATFPLFVNTSNDPFLWPFLKLGVLHSWRQKHSFFPGKNCLLIPQNIKIWGAKSVTGFSKRKSSTDLKLFHLIFGHVLQFSSFRFTWKRHDKHQLQTKLLEVRPQKPGRELTGTSVKVVCQWHGGYVGCHFIVRVQIYAQWAVAVQSKSVIHIWPPTALQMKRLTIFEPFFCTVQAFLQAVAHFARRKNPVNLLVSVNSRAHFPKGSGRLNCFWPLVHTVCVFRNTAYPSAPPVCTSLRHVAGSEQRITNRSFANRNTSNSLVFQLFLLLHFFLETKTQILILQLQRQSNSTLESSLFQKEENEILCSSEILQIVSMGHGTCMSKIDFLSDSTVWILSWICLSCKKIMCIV